MDSLKQERTFRKSTYFLWKFILIIITALKVKRYRCESDMPFITGWSFEITPPVSLSQIESSTIDGNVEFVHSEYSSILTSKVSTVLCVWQSYYK